MELKRTNGSPSRVHRFGDDVDTDVIIPARFCTTLDRAELARHCMADLDGEFAARCEDGDVIVAGANFGCGSSREHAPISIKGAGVTAVIAASFARIFFRNAINVGLAVYESPDASRSVREGDLIEVRPEDGIIINHTRGEEYRFAPYDPRVREIIEAGGLIGFVRQQLE